MPLFAPAHWLSCPRGGRLGSSIGFYGASLPSGGDQKKKANFCGPLELQHEKDCMLPPQRKRQPRRPGSSSYLAKLVLELLKSRVIATLCHIWMDRVNCRTKLV